MNGILGTLHWVFRLALARFAGTTSASDSLDTTVAPPEVATNSASLWRANHYRLQLKRHALQMGELRSDGSIPLWCPDCNRVVERRERRSQLQG